MARPTMSASEVPDPTLLIAAREGGNLFIRVFEIYRVRSTAGKLVADLEEVLNE
ncbi:MAG: hypothetical protein P8Y44_05605 [Acidobacteriota bacterium]